MDFQFKFTKDRIADPIDLRPTRHRYLGIFGVKNKVIRGEQSKFNYNGNMAINK